MVENGLGNMQERCNRSYRNHSPAVALSRAHPLPQGFHKALGHAVPVGAGMPAKGPAPPTPHSIQPRLSHSLLLSGVPR
ncbi:hypothetical protein FPB55_22805 [Pseudomonas sp. BJP69]|nr:hypothetical protein FPB55_22805 [Pseudomonas sp. BJP69]